MSIPALCCAIRILTILLVCSVSVHVLAVLLICAISVHVLAMLYVAPVLTLIGICDRQPEREGECLEKLRQHVTLFFRLVRGGNNREI